VSRQKFPSIVRKTFPADSRILRSNRLFLTLIYRHSGYFMYKTKHCTSSCNSSNLLLEVTGFWSRRKFSLLREICALLGYNRVSSGYPRRGQISSASRRQPEITDSLLRVLPQLLQKEMLSLNSLDRSWVLQEVEASRISRQSAHEGGKVVSLMHRPPLPPHVIPFILICLRGCFDPRGLVRLEGLSQWKIPIEAATFRLV
jgi:hypothetical protein